MAGRGQVGSPTMNERYTGHQWDGETGLLYAGARLLDPAIGRWMSVDPLVDMYPAWSPYNYVMNNPVSFWDHDGREVRCKTQGDCQQAADEINAAHANHEGETNVTVVETGWTESNFNLFDPSTWFDGAVTVPSKASTRPTVEERKPTRLVRRPVRNGTVS